jgi:hypothetical protein
VDSRGRAEGGGRRAEGGGRRAEGRGWREEGGGQRAEWRRSGGWVEDDVRHRCRGDYLLVLFFLPSPSHILFRVLVVFFFLFCCRSSGRFKITHVLFFPAPETEN